VNTDEALAGGEGGWLRDVTHGRPFTKSIDCYDSHHTKKTA
jgi:hypothetical protein